MVQAITAWFPNAAYANLYGIVVLAALLSDEVVPRLTGGKGFSFGLGRDRGSFMFISLCSLAGLGASFCFRYLNIGVTPFWVQVLALPLLVIGTVIREWAIVLLGRFFSRTVKIEQGHRLTTSGPFRWIRHPAYTGMLIMNTSIVLGLGSWAGALVMFILMLLAALYRMRIEEKALLEAFGDEYRAYMQRTGRLLPLW